MEDLAAARAGGAEAAASAPKGSSRRGGGVRSGQLKERRCFKDRDKIIENHMKTRKLKTCGRFKIWIWNERLWISFQR